MPLSNIVCHSLILPRQILWILPHTKYLNSVLQRDASAAKVETILVRDDVPPTEKTFFGSIYNFSIKTSCVIYQNLEFLSCVPVHCLSNLRTCSITVFCCFVMVFEGQDLEWIPK